MPRRTLVKKPLVEAILEVRWALETKQPGTQIDPQYKLLLGRFQERVRDRYPEYEQLPAAALPDELIPYNVQHRFRRNANGWPLVQLGPGLLTVNETETYDWTTFRPLTLEAFQKLFEAYPQPERL